MKSSNSADPCKRRLKVASLQSLSCLLTLKPQSLSTSSNSPVQYTRKCNDGKMCIHIDSLIMVYEHFGGSGGGIHILWGSASNHVHRDQTSLKSSQT